MLRDVALGSTDRFDDVLHANLAVTEHAKDLQAQRVSDGLQCARGGLDVLVLLYECEDVVFVHKRIGIGKINSIKYRILPTVG